MDGQKDKGIAIVLEVIPALFGFFGIGWLYTGETGIGLTLLVSGIVLIVGGYSLIFFGATLFTALTAGLGSFAFCLMCLLPLLQLGGIIGSALTLNARFEKTGI